MARASIIKTEKKIANFATESRPSQYPAQVVENVGEIRLLIAFTPAVASIDSS